jgi:uncharacterized protein YerC
MNIKDSLLLLHFIENLLIEEGGQSITDIQRHIIEDLLQGKTYKEIADDHGYDEKHIGDVSRNKIFKVISQQLGLKEGLKETDVKKDVNKHNFRWVIEKAINSQQFVNSHHNCINFPPSYIKKTEDNLANESKQPTFYHDLTLAPQISKFYNRESELKNLENWLINEHHKLISVLGLKGIGKTTLVKRFVDLNRDKFEVIIWQSLDFPDFLDLFIDNLLNLVEIENKNNNNVRQLFELLKQKKCLIIFDDVQNIFVKEELAGQFKLEYREYQNLFRKIVEIEHQSSLILISQEKCDEMHCLDEELYAVKCLELSGLNNIEILKNIGLKDENSWLSLVKLYEGNPTYLQDIAILINDVYDGHVADFLNENNIIISTKIQVIFTEVFERLSSQEKKITIALSKLEKAITRDDLKSNLSLSDLDFIQGLQSLQKRFLVTKIKDEKILFILSPVFKEYLRNFC